MEVSFKSYPCTIVVSTQTQSVDELDPSTVLVSSGVPDYSDKWEENDDLCFCLFDEMPLDVFDNDVCFPTPLVLLVPLLILLTMLKIFLRDLPHLNTFFMQSQLMIVTMQILFGLS